MSVIGRTKVGLRPDCDGDLIRQINGAAINQNSLSPDDKRITQTEGWQGWRTPE